MKQRETILASGVSSETPIHTQATARPWHLDNTAGPRIYARDHKGIFPIADIRGWGHLTGKGEGALGLSHDEGAAIQDANAALIVKAVNRDHHFDELVKALGDAIHMLETAAARFNMMGGVGLVNGANPKIGYSEIMDELPSIRAALAGAK